MSVKLTEKSNVQSIYPDLQYVKYKLCTNYKENPNLLKPKRFFMVLVLTFSLA